MMNTISKLIKITGSIGLSCVCLTAEAEPKTMTLEEVKAFLKEQKEETAKRFQWLNEEIKEINAIGAGDAMCQKRVNNVSKENKKSGVRSITYNYYGVPCAIETIGQTAGIDLYNAINPTDARYKYMTERVAALSSNLNTISEKLTAEELKKLETPEKDRLLDGFVIRRITFDTILLSGFFDESSCTKGKEWCSDRKKLEEAIDAYVENVIILKYLPIRHISYNEPDLTFAYDRMSEKMTVRPTFGKSTWGTPDHFIYKLSGDPLGQKRELLKKTLKGMLKYKNGKEKVILLLLLDKMTPSEYRFEWVDGRWAEYLHNVNRIEFNFSDKRVHKFLSHEIGHYLQFHLRLHQTFRDYQNAFAKKLLLLEAPFEDDDKVCSIPEVLRGLFKKFEKSGGDAPETLTKNNLFMYWQLASRWNDPAEISNILGVYFDQDTIYVCTLSDICEQKYVRYGHAYCGGVCSEYKEKQKEGCGFSNRNDRDYFEKIIQKAAEAKPDAEVLKLLCKLHGASFNGIVNLFDAKNEEEANKLEVRYNDFRPSEE
jgi:hypothetical protein